MILITSIGLAAGLVVSTTGLATITPDTPTSSAFTVSIGKITSVGLYGGTNVSTTGLYSQATVSPVTDIRRLYVGADNSLSIYYVNSVGGVIPVSAVYYGTQKVFGVA